MDKKAKKLLEQFQCDYIRRAEESFARTLSENENVRLFFINENQAYTDGRNIVVDPAEEEEFCNRPVLNACCAFLGWPKTMLDDGWKALAIITRAQTIHECLHLLYTDFPLRHLSDPKCDTKNKLRVMGMIANIIEDAYIEAAGCSCFDNMDFYIRFGRVAPYYANMFRKKDDAPAEDAMTNVVMDDDSGTTEQEDTETERMSFTRPGTEQIGDFLNYMAHILLWPMFPQEDPPADISFYTASARELFLKGSMAPSPAERYAYVSRIFDIIAHLIPPDEDIIDLQPLEELLNGSKTHSGGNSPGGEISRGRTQPVTIRPFSDAEGNPRESSDSADALLIALRQIAADRDTARQMEKKASGSHTVLMGGDYDCSPIHRDIRINENRPKINFNHRKAYQNIRKRYQVSVRSYSSRFAQLLKARVQQREEKQYFGSGINSARLGDIKRRFWYRTIEGEDVPDLAVLLLIDGSGSMEGARCKAAMHSAVILHEVLKKQGISHAVVEHRGNDETEKAIDVNILVDFNAREDEELNLMQLKAHWDNRDGLALIWAERYMTQHTQNEHRVIIILSDGQPAHDAGNYYPPVSTKDTANIVKKLLKRGTNVIAVSLDDPDEYDCYEDLSEIYPKTHLVACNDLNRLPGQILGIIAKLLQ